MQKISNKAITILTITAISLVFFLYLVKDIILPFILSAFLAYLLSPVIAWLRSFGIKKALAVAILFAGFFAVFAGSVALLLPAAVEEVKVLNRSLPGHIAEIKLLAVETQLKLEAKYPLLKEKAVIDNAAAQLQQAVENETAKIPSYLLSFFSLFSLLILIPVLTLFMLLSGEEMFDKLFEAVPSRFIETTMGLIYEADSVLGGFLRGQMIETAFVGVMSIIGLLFLKVDYAVTIGILAGFGNMIPYLGPFVGLVLAVAVGVIKYKTMAIVLKIVVLFLFIQFLDNNFVQPMTLGRGVDISPVAMIFALMAGAQIFGFMGMIFSVPAAGIIKTVFKVFVKPQVLRAAPSEKPII